MEIHKKGETSPVRKCSAHNCPGLAHGWLRMNIPAVGDPAAPALQLPVHLFMCPLHFKLASAKDFQTDEWRAQMLVVLKNRGATAVPDFDAAFLDIVPFDQDNGIAQAEVPHGNA